ncbi:hypothetical protein ACOMHN_016978 [Nucella lapillus]
MARCAHGPMCPRPDMPTARCGHIDARRWQTKGDDWR